MQISVALLVAGLGASRQRSKEMLEAATYQNDSKGNWELCDERQSTHCHHGC